MRKRSKGFRIRRFWILETTVKSNPPALDSHVEKLAELMGKMGDIIREHRCPDMVAAQKEEPSSQH